MGRLFKVVSGTASNQLAPNQSLTLQIQFTAAAAGAATGQLAITSNATNGTSATLALSGSGTSATSAQISASATTLNFGNVALNKPATQALTLTSTGTASLTISSVAASGTGYRVVAGSLPITLAPKQTATVQVQFDPTSAGTNAQKTYDRQQCSGKWLVGDCTEWIRTGRTYSAAGVEPTKLFA